ncbi:MAG TPA: GSU2403 family nucleotidyltransferase fold protein [bacterium]|nr:GSU2403 family nucleotidyltransferase fold protein [bacterium]
MDLAIRNLFSEFQESVFARMDLEKSLKESGTFVRKTVKGKIYWYLQRYEEGQAKQVYFGRTDGKTEAQVVEARKKRRGEREILKKMRNDEERRAAALRRAGLPFADAAAATVLESLSEKSLIDRGGVLVGSHAFAAYSGILGFLFEKQSLKTLDIDVVGDKTLRPDDRSDVPAMEILSADFRPIPPLSLKNLPNRFASPHGLRVDFLIPQRGKPKAGCRAVGLKDVGAEPLPFLDFLIERPIRVALLSPWGGIPVTIPDPSRFAIHKLIVSVRRSVAEDAKRAKDLVQARQLIVACAQERPADLKQALRDARDRGKRWRQSLNRAVTALPDEIAGLLS